MTQDLNKGIQGIKYNSLNLPQEMVISHTSARAKNYYSYNASGVKLRTIHRSDPTLKNNPVLGTTISNDGLGYPVTTDYVGNKIYENGALKKILVDNGYIENGNYYFYVKDHLGNNRIVTNAAAGVQQSNQYYPFGMMFAESSNPKVQDYKYNGKELDLMHGLNHYDYSARQYDPARLQFTTVDPLAEKYYSISPYVYVANNPLKYIDPDGKQMIIPPFFGMNPVLAGSSTPLLGAADVVEVGVRTGVGETVRVGVRTTAEVGSKTSESTGGNKPSINMERLNAGRRIEGEQLQKLGMEKNTESITRIDPKTGKEGTTVPDGIKNGGSTEIKNLKDGATQSLTKQLRLQKEFSNGNGQVPKLHINRGVNLSKPLQEAGFEVTRYSTVPVMPQDNTSVVIKKLEF